VWIRFTWNNKSEGFNFVARKLDRVMVNEEWFCQYGGTNVDFPPGGVSDHSPAIISIGFMVSFGPKPFKFFNYWLENSDFMDWLSTCWRQEVYGVPMYKLYRKLKSFKFFLKAEVPSRYGDLKNRVIQARESLDLAQKAVMEFHGRADCLLRERESLHAYVSISRAEEAFLK